MEYFITYVLTFFGISFCIVYFALKRFYLKKHGKEMSRNGVIGRTILIGILLFVITSLGGM